MDMLKLSFSLLSVMPSKPIPNLCFMLQRFENFGEWHNVQYSVVTFPVIGRQVEVVPFFSLLSVSQPVCWDVVGQGNKMVDLLSQGYDTKYVI